VAATFNYLGMTHTCPNLLWTIQIIPDHRRIEIEHEEEELFFDLEEIIARFDLFSERFGDDLSQCVDEFFDDLEGELIRSLKDTYAYGNVTEPDFFGWGKVRTFRSCRGRRIKHGYKEIVEEESMLRCLFP
jgi:hypothetical protein